MPAKKSAPAKKKAPGASYYSSVRSATWAYTADKFTEVVYLWRQWLALVKKKEATASVAWKALFRRRLLARVAKIKEAACKKKKWKTPACKTFKVKVARDRAAAKRKAAAGYERQRVRPPSRMSWTKD